MPGSLTQLSRGGLLQNIWNNSLAPGPVDPTYSPVGQTPPRATKPTPAASIADARGILSGRQQGNPIGAAMLLGDTPQDTLAEMNRSESRSTSRLKAQAKQRLPGARLTQRKAGLLFPYAFSSYTTTPLAIQRSLETSPLGNV